MRKCVIAIALISLASAVHAQRGGATAAGFRRVETEMVKGAPYSADVINESVQVLSDGNRIVHHSTSRVYRDSEGRTRQETDRPSGAPEVSINDPVAGTFFSLNGDNHTARQSPAPLFFSGNVNRGGELERLNVLINGQLSSFVARGGNTAWVIGPNTNGQSTEEKLSARTIEGVRVEGIRRTMTIPAGEIGNERPIAVTSEEWTSPELKVLVLSESNDPRTGTSTYKLVNVKRGDPSPSLFQVPADYTIVQPQGRGEGRGARSSAPPR